MLVTWDRFEPSGIEPSGITIDRDHLFRVIATTLWTGVTGVVG